jgi:hypothetical protein
LSKSDTKSDAASDCDSDNAGFSTVPTSKYKPTKLDPIMRVRCKTTTALMYKTKFVSGSKGKCILFNNQWLTPNRFEEQAGSKAKQYLRSIKCLEQPLKVFVDSGELKINPTDDKSADDTSNDYIYDHMYESIMEEDNSGQLKSSNIIQQKNENTISEIKIENDQEPILSLKSAVKMEYNWEEPRKSKKSIIWSHFHEDRKHEKAKIVDCKGGSTKGLIVHIRYCNTCCGVFKGGIQS